MSDNSNLTKALELFKNHYSKRLGQVEPKIVENQDGITEQFIVQSGLLKGDGNYPMVFHHQKITRDVIVLTHGLSDSPYYMTAIARQFYARGANVVIPLLPAHGLKDPDKAMEDYKMDAKWRDEIDNAVETALLLGERVSLGGFSTGGALSLNKILRTPDKITGGLFLFSGALDLGSLKEKLSLVKFAQSIVKLTDGKIEGEGRNPYKYPVMPVFAGFELGQIINQNEDLLKKKSKDNPAIANPVFVAHSVHDTVVKLDGIIEFLKNHVHRGIGFVISANVPHSHLVLEHNIPLDQGRTGEPREEPTANPEFHRMMDDALRFFQDHVVQP